jgi:hypothetical protein
MTSKEFAEKLNDWARGTMIRGHGTRVLSVGAGRVVAPSAAMWETKPTGELVRA